MLVWIHNTVVLHDCDNILYQAFLKSMSKLSVSSVNQSQKSFLLLVCISGCTDFFHHWKSKQAISVKNCKSERYWTIPEIKLCIISHYLSLQRVWHEVANFVKPCFDLFNSCILFKQTVKVLNHSLTYTTQLPTSNHLFAWIRLYANISCYYILSYCTTNHVPSRLPRLLQRSQNLESN